MSNDALIARVERFERTVAMCLCAMPTLFSLQCISLGLSGRVFRAMYADFGAKLPELTTIVIRFAPFWVLLGAAAPIVCIALALRGSARASVVTSTIVALVLFFIGSAGVVGLFLPLLELGSVAANLE
jgi:hypothetical protein